MKTCERSGENAYLIQVMVKYMISSKNCIKKINHPQEDKNSNM